MKQKGAGIMKKVFFFVFSLFTPLLAIGCCPYQLTHGWGNGYMMNYGFGYGGMFMWLIFAILTGVVIYFIMQSSKSKDSAGPAQDTPLDILKKRYAKGEINKEEFDRIKKDLE
jgi:putative membrane protein